MNDMKKSSIAIIIAVCTLLLSACTQNNGDIGPLFGFWRLTELTSNGEPVEGFTSGDEVWSFQNNIIFILSLGEAHDYDERAGTWERDASTLTLDFTHWKGQGDMEYYYIPPAILGFSIERPNVMTVDLLTSSEMCLRMTTDGGDVMAYRLEKVY